MGAGTQQFPSHLYVPPQTQIIDDCRHQPSVSNNSSCFFLPLTPTYTDAAYAKQHSTNPEIMVRCYYSWNEHNITGMFNYYQTQWSSTRSAIQLFLWKIWVGLKTQQDCGPGRTGLMTPDITVALHIQYKLNSNSLCAILYMLSGLVN